MQETYKINKIAIQESSKTIKSNPKLQARKHYSISISILFKQNEISIDGSMMNPIKVIIYFRNLLSSITFCVNIYFQNNQGFHFPSNENFCE
jgi:type IV secretory pathway component VirB8